MGMGMDDDEYTDSDYDSDGDESSSASRSDDGGPFEDSSDSNSDDNLDKALVAPNKTLFVRLPLRTFFELYLLTAICRANTTVSNSTALRLSFGFAGAHQRVRYAMCVENALRRLTLALPHRAETCLLPPISTAAATRINTPARARELTRAGRRRRGGLSSRRTRAATPVAGGRVAKESGTGSLVGRRGGAEGRGRGE